MSLITILGAAGFIGSALARRLTDMGLNCQTPAKGQDPAGRKLGDVIYCVGLTADFRSRPFETVEAHVCHLLHVLRDCDFESLVYLSSTRVYRNQAGIGREDDLVSIDSSNPDDLYGTSKLMGESVALASGRKVRIARLSNVYGADFNSENFLSTMVKDAVSGNEITVRSSPDSAKDYISLNDVVEGLIKITREGKQDIYNLASGVNVSNLQLTQRLSELTNCRITFDPAGATQCFPRINIDRMQSEFRFQPRSILEELETVVESYQAHYQKQRSPH
jgi:nucleoside-diphosphate-sugar epimerase